MPRFPPPNNIEFRQERGAALLLVLWVVALMATMAMTQLHSVRIASQQTTQSVAQFMRQAALENCLAAWGLAMEQGKPFPLDGSKVRLSHSAGSCYLEMSDERQRVDVNYADSGQLAAWLLEPGVDVPDHATLSAVMNQRSTTPSSDSTDRVMPFFLSASDAANAAQINIEEAESILPYLTVFTHASRPLSTGNTEKRVMGSLLRLSLQEANAASREGLNVVLRNTAYGSTPFMVGEYQRMLHE